MRRLIGGIVVLLLASGGVASAHIVGARLGDFYNGALHPLTDPQDVLLWLALGVFAGSLGAARGRWLVLVFPLGLLAGLTIATAFKLPGAGPLADAALTIGIGLLLAAALRLSTAWVCAVAVVIGLLRGAANAAGAGPGSDMVLFATGLAAVGYVVITLTMAATLAFRGTAGWRMIALRACGSWIAAIGLMMGGFALAR